MLWCECVPWNVLAIVVGWLVGLVLPVVSNADFGWVGTDCGICGVVAVVLLGWVRIGLGLRWSFSCRLLFSVGLV